MIVCDVFVFQSASALCHLPAIDLVDVSQRDANLIDRALLVGSGDRPRTKDSEGNGT